MSSGYISFTSPVQGSTHSYFHWVVEAEAGAANAPLLFWTNGGPGCSGLYGMGLENGPFIIQANGSLTPSALSWNKFATVVYIEMPVGVGFSFSSNPNDYAHLDDDVARTDGYAFLQAFFAAYPQYAVQPLWLTSESYGGNYIPELARAVLTGNDSSLAARLVAGGVVVGNPVFSTSTATYMDIVNAVQADILYGHATLPASFVTQYNAAGCNTLAPLDRKACADLRATMFNLAGACFATNDCGDDLYSDVYGNATLGPVITAGGYDRDVAWDAWLDRADVQAAIHAQAPPFPPWQDCTDGITYALTWPSLLPAYAALEGAGVRTLVLSGDVDVATVPFATTQLALSTLNRTVVRPWAAWTVTTGAGANQTAGYVEVYSGNLTFATVKAGGHEAGAYQPLATFDLVSSFIAGADFPSPPPPSPAATLHSRAASRHTQAARLRTAMAAGGVRARRAA